MKTIVKKHRRKGRIVRQHTRKVKHKRNYGGAFFQEGSTLQQVVDPSQGSILDPGFNLTKDSAIGATTEDPREIRKLVKDIKKNYGNGLNHDEVFMRYSTNEKKMRSNSNKIRSLGHSTLSEGKRNKLLLENDILRDTNTHLINLLGEDD